MNKIESAQLISRMLYKYIKDSNKIPTDTCNNELHVSSLKKMKKNNDITRDNINICFLSQIPGINEKTANSINNYFENCSFDIMIQRIREEPNILENIKINTNNKFRKISKNNIEKIIEFLL